MIYNESNDKYKSALEGLSFEARQADIPAIEFHRGRGRRMESDKFYLRPVPRKPPDIQRIGRAILELAMRWPDQKSGGN